VILVDTSVWIDHLRKSSSKFASRLQKAEVLLHPFVPGEIACGNLKNREEIIGLLHALPVAEKADDDEVLFFVERHALMERGIGWVDAHLLASCRMASCRLWRKDKRLKTIAEEMKVDLSV